MMGRKIVKAKFTRENKKGAKMAANFISPPGTEFGPCENEECGHTDCAWARRMVESVCPYCDEPIGYQRGYYMEGIEDQYPAHSSCAEAALVRRIVRKESQ